MKIYIFDLDGLRFDRQYLSEMRLAVLQLPIEEQSEFVDRVTYDNCRKGVPIVSTEDVNTLENVERFIDTTSIGNLAFIALNHPSHEQQVYAKAILLKLKALKKEAN